MKKHLLLTACALFALPFAAMAQYTHQLSSIERDSYGQKVQMVYDAEGRLVQKMVLSHKYGGEPDEMKLDSLLTRTYDGDKITQVYENITNDISWKKKIITIKDKNSIRVEQYMPNYDEPQQLFKERETIKTYDDTHRILTETFNRYNAGNELLSSYSYVITYTYDGNKVTMEKNRDNYLERNVYTNTDEGKLLVDEYYRFTDKYTGVEEWILETKKVYGYDDHGNSTGYSEHSYWEYDYYDRKYVNNETVTENFITNTYDANGNLVKTESKDLRVTYEKPNTLTNVVTYETKGWSGEWSYSTCIAYDLDKDNNNCISNCTWYYWDSSTNNWDVSRTIDWGFSKTLETNKVMGAVEDISVIFRTNYSSGDQEPDIVSHPKMALLFELQPGNAAGGGKSDYYNYTPISVLPAQSNGNVVVVPMFDGTNTVAFENNSVVYLLDNMGVKRYYATLTDATCEYDIFSNKLYIKGWKEYTEPAAAPKHATRADGSGIVADGDYTIVFPENVLTVNGTTLGETITVVNVDESIETGIQTVAAPQSTNALYNLQGQKITAPANGQIVIMNGKKVVVK